MTRVNFLNPINVEKKMHHREIWFLQTILKQKTKEQVCVMLDENCSFESIFNFLSSNCCYCKDIHSQYDIYLKKLRRQPSVLTRNEIETLRNKKLSLQAPLSLEYRGNPNTLSKKTIGIVGSRHPTFYGRLQAQKFARELSQLGYAIVSGGAIGIDAIANLYGLEGENGASISVIGNGIENPYPPSNQRLFYNLSHSKNGLLLSEFSSQSKACKWSFPQRNATIAELSDFLLVIEATPTSGSLMTAKFARECGKEVGAVPGNVDNPNTLGSHLLIQNGARCIQQPKDILQYM